jgi:translation initiation factor 1
MSKKKRIPTDGSKSSAAANPFEALAALKNILPEENEGATAELEEVNEVSSIREKLHLRFERKGRNGKPVTIVTNWSSTEIAEMHERDLKKHCGVGGSLKNGELILQGNQIDAVKTYAKEQGWIV